MKPITEQFVGTLSIRDIIEADMVDEGLMDFFKLMKEKFKAAFMYLKGVVAKFGTYFLPVDKDGNVLDAISPLTAGQAYKDGLIDKACTVVVLDRQGKKITGLNTKYDDALKLYGSGNSISYWKQVMESYETNGNLVNEVKMHTEDPQAKYNIICDNDMLVKQIEMVIKNKNLARLLIMGAPGIGKTASLLAVIDTMKKKFPDYRLIVKTLSNETPDNFTLPKYVEIDGQEKATDVPKTWLPVYRPTGDPAKDAELDEACGSGLLFIDELSRATPQVLNVILPLVNEGMFNGYKLGSNWTIICASNRAEDEMSGQADIGNALANRFAIVYYEPTVKTWSNWAKKQNYISPLVLQWLNMPETENMSGAKFFYMDPNEDMEDGGVTKLMCTPRSWTNAMRELALYSETGSLEGFSIFDIPTNILTFTLNKYIPSSAIDSLMSFLHVISKIGNFDAAVEAVWQNGGSGLKIDKKDLGLVSLPLAQLIVSAHAKELPTEEEVGNLAKWLISTGSDQLTSYVLDVFKEVFCGMLYSTDLKDGCFLLADYIKKADKQKRAMFESAYKPFLTKWGITLDTVPDWSKALMELGKKYKDSFNIKINGKDALG